VIFPVRNYLRLALHHSLLTERVLPDHPIRTHQHVWRYRQADLLGSFEIDNELELHRLLDRQVGWIRSLRPFDKLRACFTRDRVFSDLLFVLKISHSRPEQIQELDFISIGNAVMN